MTYWDSFHIVAQYYGFGLQTFYIMALNWTGYSMISRDIVIDNFHIPK